MAEVAAGAEALTHSSDQLRLGPPPSPLLFPVAGWVRESAHHSASEQWAMRERNLQLNVADLHRKVRQRQAEPPQ